MNHPFTLTDAIVTFGILFIGLILIHYWNHKEQKRLEKIERERWPKAKRLPKSIEDSLDDFERKIS